MFLKFLRSVQIRIQSQYRGLQVIGVALVVAVVVASTPRCLAQTAVTGAITGTVTDPTGAVVPGAKVVVTNEATGLSRVTNADGSGRYALPSLPPGTYKVDVSNAGFKESVHAGVQVAVTETAALNATLEVGASTETVTISADQQALQTENSAFGRVVDSKQMTALPLVTRNFTQILGLSPGVNMAVTNAGDLGKGNSASSGGANGVKIVNGARPTDNNFQLNGIAANDNFGAGSGTGYGLADAGGGLPVPNPDAIQEFKVQTGQYDASFGRNAGGNVDIITKVGEDAFHGSIFEFFRNTALDANDYFRKQLGQPRQVLKQNQFGFTVGGPIVRKKAFFFTSYQGTRQANGIATGCSAVYSGPPLTNDRSQAGLGALFAGMTGLNGGEAINANGSNINPIALAVLNLKLANGQYFVPTPQSVNTAKAFSAQGTSSFSYPCTFNEDQFLINGEYAPSQKHTLSPRYFQANDSQVGTLGSSNAPGVTAPHNAIYHNFSLADTYIFSPRFVNEAIVGVNIINTSQPAGQAATTSPFYWPALGSNVPADFGQTGITISGSFTVSAQPALTIRQPAFTVVDSATYSKGKHTLKFGGGIARSYVSTSGYTLPTTYTFSTFSDFLLGLPGGPIASGGNGTTASNIVESYGGIVLFNRKYRKWDGDLYFQDDWTVARRLTVNLGARYDRLGSLNDALGRLGSFDRSTANPNPPATGTLAGYIVSGNFPGTVPTGVAQTNHSYAIDGDGQNGFSPRIGFSWQVFPSSSKAVLRGGFGLYSSELAASGVQTGFVSGPFIYNAATPGTANPQISLANPFGTGAIPTLSQLPLFTPYSSTSLIGQIQYENPHYRPGYIEEFSLGTQTDLGHGYMLEIAYVGTHGVHLSRGLLPNEANLASASNPIRGITTNTVANINQRVPILGFAPTAQVENETSGQSWFNSLQTSLTKRLSHGLQFLGSYTFSKNLDTDAPNITEAVQGTSGDAIGNDRLPHGRYGRTNFDRTNRFVGSYTYDLPSLQHEGRLLSKVTGGWQLAGVTEYQSGTWLTVTSTNSKNVIGATTDFAPLSGACAPGNYVRSGTVVSKLNSYFNTNCFSFNPTTHAAIYPIVGDDGIATGFGNSGVGNATGPGQKNWDMALVKRTAVGWPNDGANVEFRTEFFNAFNTPQFANPDSKITDAAFGTITSTVVNPRIIQFAIRLNY